MKLVDRLVLRELVGPFIFGVMAFTTVFFAGSYMLKLTEWMSRGMPLTTAVEVVFLILPSMLVLTLPAATLLAVLLGFGRLSGDSEVVAFFAGGISLYRVAAPVFALGILVSAFSVGLAEFISPKAYMRFGEIRARVLKETAPRNQPFTVRDDATNSRVDVNGGIDPKTGILRDVTITQYARITQKIDGREVVSNRPALVFYASRARWAGLNDPEKRYTWLLYDGWWQIVGADSGAILRFTTSHTKQIEIDKTPDEFALYQRSVGKDTDQLSFSELGRMIKYVKSHPDRPLADIRQLEVNRWNKLALPLSSLVFAVIATPLGIKPHRSSSSVGFGLSVLLIFLYWILWNYTSRLSVQGSLEPFAGAFTADALGIGAALLLIRRAAK